MKKNAYINTQTQTHKFSHSLIKKCFSQYKMFREETEERVTILIINEEEELQGVQRNVKEGQDYLSV